MKTLKELGQKAKRAEPDEYGHLSDEEAGRRAKRDYYPLYEDYEETALVRRRQLTDIRRHEHLQMATELVRYFDPNEGIFSAWMTRYQNAKRSNTLDTYLPVSLKLIEHGALLEQAAFDSEKRYQEYIAFIENNAIQLKLFREHLKLAKKAARKGFTIEGLEKYNLLEAEIKGRLRVIETEYRERLKYEKEMALIHQDNARNEQRYKTSAELYLEMCRREREETEHRRRLEAIELEHQRKMEGLQRQLQIESDNEIKLAQEQLRLQIISKHLTEQQKIAFVQDLIDQQYKFIAETQADRTLTAEAKRSIIESRQRIIQMFMEQQNEAQRKILQSK